MAMKGGFDGDIYESIVLLILCIIAVLIVLYILRNRQPEHSSSDKPERGFWARLSNAFFHSTIHGQSEASSEDEGKTRYERSKLEYEPPQKIVLESGYRETIDREFNRIWNYIKRLEKQNDDNHEELWKELKSVRDSPGTPMIQEMVHHSQVILQKQKESYHSPPQKLHYAESGPAHQGDALTEALCRSYNESVQDKRRQQNFKDEHKPVRIHVTNYMDRAKDSTISPEFREDYRGDFDAIRRKDGKYMVVPRFNLTIRFPQYGPGAIGEVFTCHNYVSGGTYQIIELIQPAIFTNNGEIWEMAQRGELRLS
jgi:hypothetical protein